MTSSDATQRRAELRALSSLAIEELGGASSGVGKVHRAISDRVFWAIGLGLGTTVKPVKAIHDRITDGVYRSIAVTTSATAKVASNLADAPIKVPSRTVAGSMAIGVVLGLRGDTLEAEQNPLAAPMSVRISGDVLDDFATFPRATPRVVVFLHGLVETEDAWRFGGRTPYGERLREHGWTPVYLRYNTGRHISENGRSLAELLDRLHASWPGGVEELVLVGHSLGGLVIRSAGHYATQAGYSWASRTRAVISLGTPHLGAPLESLAHFASAALVKLPETGPFGRLLRRRSAGIRDLRQGSLVDEDWRDQSADSLRARACAEVPLLDGVEYYFVAATIGKSPRNPVGRLIGDGLVLRTSANGENRSRRLGFKLENGMHLQGANHFTLLNNDAVYEQLRQWIN